VRDFIRTVTSRLKAFFRKIFFVRWSIRKKLLHKILDKAQLKSTYPVVLIGNREELSFNSIRGFDGDIPERFQYFVENRFQTDHIYCAVLHRVNLMGPCAMPVTANNEIVLTSQLNDLSVIDRCSPRHFNNVKLFRVDKRVPFVVSLVNIYNNAAIHNYFHWLIDSVLQLIYIENILDKGETQKSITLVIPKDLPAEFVNVLHRLGYTTNQLMVWDGITRLYTEKYYAFSTIRTKTLSLIHI